jgi:hypothetical protein
MTTHHGAAIRVGSGRRAGSVPSDFTTSEREEHDMADEWQTKKVDDVQPGDVVRYRDQEFTVARVDAPFLGRDQMVCMIEDTPTRWHAYPAPLGVDVEVRAG